MYSMSILDFGKIIFGPVEDIISWMQRKHLLASSKDCSGYNIAMVWSTRSDRSDGYRYGILIMITITYIIKI